MGNEVRLTLIAAGALLTGCVDAFSQLRSEVLQYQGQKVDALIDRIGYPDDQTLTAGGVVYTWTTTESMQVDLQPTHTVSVDASDGPIISTTRVPGAVNLHFRCPLQVETDRAGTILHLSWERQGGSCAP